MNRRDKLRVITEANQRVEKSYLKSKGFLKEDNMVNIVFFIFLKYFASDSCLML